MNVTIGPKDLAEPGTPGVPADPLEPPGVDDLYAEGEAVDSRPAPVCRSTGMPGLAVAGRKLGDAAVAGNDEVGRSPGAAIAQPGDAGAGIETAGCVMQDDSLRGETRTDIWSFAEGHRNRIVSQDVISDVVHLNLSFFGRESGSAAACGLQTKKGGSEEPPPCPGMTPDDQICRASRVFSKRPTSSMPCASWNALRADTLEASKRPSAGPLKNPAAASFDWMIFTASRLRAATE